MNELLNELSALAWALGGSLEERREEDPRVRQAIALLRQALEALNSVEEDAA